MRRWIGILIGFGLIIMLGGIGYLYQFGGLRQYIRARSVINNMPTEDKQYAWEKFSGTDPRGAERGILAGSGLGRVWVWSSSGLKSFIVDEYSIYSWFDACREDVKEKLRAGEGGSVIEQVIDTDLNSWREKAKVGDYVAVYPTQAEQGGTIGNLREIYTYNFWLFMKAGIDTQCGK